MYLAARVPGIGSLFALVACGASTSAPSARAERATPAPAIDPPIPSELANAPAWIYRHLATGKVVRLHLLDTWTLRMHGDRAMVLHEQMTSSLGELGPWTSTNRDLWIGTVNADTVLRLAGDGRELVLRCMPETLEVARASAIRQPHPKTGKYAPECSGDPGRWVPPEQTRIDVLACFPNEDDVPMAFARAPGVEWLHVNDRCEHDGAAYRLIGEGGEIAPVR